MLHLAPGPGEHFHRQQKTEVETVHQLGGVHNHHKTIRPCRHEFFLHVASATTLDQLEAGVDFVGTIDGQINLADGVEAEQGDVELSGKHLSLEGGGDADDVFEFSAGELGPQALNHQSGGGA